MQFLPQRFRLGSWRIARTGVGLLCFALVLGVSALALQGVQSGGLQSASGVGGEEADAGSSGSRGDGIRSWQGDLTRNDSRNDPPSTSTSRGLKSGEYTTSEAKGGEGSTKGGSEKSSGKTGVHYEYDPSLARNSLNPGGVGAPPSGDAVGLTADNRQDSQGQPGALSSSETSSSSGFGGSSLSGLRKAGPRGDEIELPAATRDQTYCVVLLEGATKATNVKGVLPRGLSVDEGSASLCGVPTDAGIFRFSAVVQASRRPGRERRFLLVVSEPKSEDEEGDLRIVTSQLAVGTVGAEYVFTVRAGGGKPPYSWAVQGLPEGFEFSPSTGLIAGTPDAEGEWPLGVEVKDAEGRTASRELSLLVRNTPVFITSHSFESGVVGEQYQSRLAAQGGTPPYRWSVTGALPKGLTLEPDAGVIRGVPEVSHDGTLQVVVSDSSDKTDRADLPLEIRSSPLEITTGGLRDGFVGQPYQFALEAKGGVTPFTWKVVSGTLPAGVSLSPDGTLRGQPSAAGDTVLTLSVQDGEGNITQRRFAMRVATVEGPDETLDNPDTQPEPGDTATPASTPPPPGSGGSGAPAPTPELPGPVAFDAVPSNGKVGLVWELPAGVGSDAVSVAVRGVEGFPSTVSEGVEVYRGTRRNAVDSGLLNGTTYYYSVFLDYGAKGVSKPGTASRRAATPEQVTISGNPGPYIDKVVSFEPLDPTGCYNCSQAETIVLGPPQGEGDNHGSYDVVSLGARVNSDNGASAPYGGSIVVRFDDNIVVNGAGPDFTIFENAFRLAGTDDIFVEPAVVDVSVNGREFFRFPFDFVAHTNPDGSLNLFNPYCYARGFAGVKPVFSKNLSPDPTNPLVSGGDTFDLSDLPGADLTWIRYIRVTAVGDGWLTDAQGELVRHSNKEPTRAASGVGNSGFDLDAVTAVNY